jgi:hypothetical protein
MANLIGLGSRHRTDHPSLAGRETAPPGCGAAKRQINKVRLSSEVRPPR